MATANGTNGVEATNGVANGHSVQQTAFTPQTQITLAGKVIASMASFL